jgi:hypothetical protein
MTRTPARRTDRRIPLPVIDFDEERWRQLRELARQDRREVDAYALVTLERHVDREYPRLARKLAATEPGTSLEPVA